MGIATDRGYRRASARMGLDRSTEQHRNDRGKRRCARVCELRTEQHKGMAKLRGRRQKRSGVYKGDVGLSDRQVLSGRRVGWGSLRQCESDQAPSDTTDIIFCAGTSQSMDTGTRSRRCEVARRWPRSVRRLPKRIRVAAHRTNRALCRAARTAVGSVSRSAMATTTCAAMASTAGSAMGAAACSTVDAATDAPSSEAKYNG
jgi:hypothetical protein